MCHKLLAIYVHTSSLYLHEIGSGCLTYVASPHFCLLAIENPSDADRGNGVAGAGQRREPVTEQRGFGTGLYTFSRSLLFTTGDPGAHHVPYWRRLLC